VLGHSANAPLTLDKGFAERPLGKGRSAKPLPSVTSALGKDKKRKKYPKKIGKQIRGGLPSASTSPFHLPTFFNVFPTKFSTLPQPRFKPRNLSHKHLTPYPLHYTITCVYIPFWFFIYYTKSHVN